MKWGVKNILFFLGSEGVLFMNNEKVFLGNLLIGMVVNIVCLGDVMLGIFLVGWY